MSEKKHETVEALKLDNQLCFPLYAASRRVVSLYTPYLKPLGLTYTQYLVFMVLQEDDGIKIGDLGSRLFLDNGTLSPMLKKMEKKGWIVRSRSSRDERVVTVSLTDEGWDMIGKLADIPGEIVSCVSLSMEKAGELYKLLYDLLEKTK